MIDETTNWKELREFKAVDLEQSFVLSWEVRAESLEIDVDLFICPEHAFYEKPRPAEKACFRPAHIEFPHCSSVSIVDVGPNRSVQDSVNSLGGGRISDLYRTGEGQYEIVGDFGVVAIRAERPMVRLKDSTI